MKSLCYLRDKPRIYYMQYEYDASNAKTKQNKKIS